MKTFKAFHFTQIILLFVFSTFILAGCHKEKDTTDELVNYVWDYAAQHPDGFTLDIQTKEPVTSGISVAYFETQNSFGKEILNKVIEHALNHENVVGGWFNGEDSLYYFDSDRIFAEGAYDEAIAFAKENLQLSIYDLTNDSLIWIEYPKLDSIYIHSKSGNRNSLIRIFEPVQ
jgi:fructokinase